MSGLRRLFVFLALAIIADVFDARSSEGIVGGDTAVLGEFPYQVSLRLRGKHACGGSIIDEFHVVTAAHCAIGLKSPYNELVVVTGTILRTAGQIHKVKSVVSHSKYSAAKLESSNDIAIIELDAAIKFDMSQDKIELPKAATESGVEAIATGWGYEKANDKTFPENLRKVILKTLAPVECQKLSPIFTIYAEQICSFEPPGRGVCKGDSGGPLAHNGELIGIVSYGKPCGVGVPDVYTDVYHYIKWVKENTGISSASTTNFFSPNFLRFSCLYIFLHTCKISSIYNFIGKELSF